MCFPRPVSSLLIYPGLWYPPLAPVLPSFLGLHSLEKIKILLAGKVLMSYTFHVLFHVIV